MFIDLSVDGPTQAPIVMVADAASRMGSAETRRTFGICQPIENIQDDKYFGKVVMAFLGDAANYLFLYEKRRTNWREGSVRLTKPPANGRLESDGSGIYLYRPNPSFHGQDTVEAVVDLGGYHVNIVYFVKVVEEGQRVGDDEESIKKYCGPKGSFWKISVQPRTLDLATPSSIFGGIALGKRSGIDP